MPDLLDRIKAAVAGRYTVERRVGSGGMAEVFLARDLKHRRPVALKLLRPEVAAALGPDRFLQEIEIAAGLNHPHILPLYDSGEADGLLYFVMPFVEEESLRDRLETRGRLAAAEAVRLAIEIAGALHHAHGKGIVHRDVKPENILLVADHAVIADFGIARAVAAASGRRLTEVGLGVGTPAYISPEQAFGEETVDARSDVYSLACVAYEMLAGRPPFPGTTVFAILAQKSQDRLELAALPPDDVGPEVDRVIRQALSFDPAARPASARAFGDALGQAMTPGRAPTHPTDRRLSLAVLPFANLSVEPDTEFLSDGLSDEIIHALTRLPDLRVLARGSAFAFKGQEVDPRIIGQKLGVELVLGGSVRRAGSRLRVMVQLVNVADGASRWSERYDREMGDVFALQDEISASIVERVAPTAGPADAAAAGTTTSQPAYERYLRGRHAWATRTGPGLQASVGLFQEALGLDPGFHLARAAEAEALVTLGLYGEGRPEDTLGRAEALAREIPAAAARAPDLVGARVALACGQAVYHWRWGAAEDGFKDAIALNPGYATAHHWYAINVLAPQRRLPAARMAIQQARALDPLAPAMGLAAGLVAYFDGNPAAALEAFDEVLAGDGRVAVAHYFAGLALVEAGRAEEAIGRMEQGLELAPEAPEQAGGLGYALAAAGRAEAARHLLDSLAERRNRRYISPVLDAQILAALGQPEAAVARLLEAESLRAADLIWIGVRPTFHVLRGIAPFDALLARLGLG